MFNFTQWDLLLGPAIPHFSPNVYIESLDDKLAFQCAKNVCYFWRVKCYEGKKKSIDKMKTNSYHFGNARFSYSKFAKSKSYLPVTDSVLFVWP